MRYLCVKTRETALGRVILAGPAVRVAKVFALVAQRVHAPLLIDKQPAGIVHCQRGLSGHVRVGLVQQPVAALVYRPERGEVNEKFWH